MKVVIAPDSFKGALSATDAAQAIARGVRRAWPGAECILLPVADGGEGTLYTLLAAAGGERITRRVTGPMGTPVDAAWGLLADGETAVVELAQAAGLTLVPTAERDPFRATTFGVGELIQDALAHPGVRQLLIALGGSATNDGGAGILQALGWSLTDEGGSPLPHGGLALAQLHRAIPAGSLPSPRGVRIRIACDVDNPLVGPRGASAVFGPQKGASPDGVVALDRALTHFAAVLGIDADRPGTGAAGGTPAGLLCIFPNAEIRPGIDLVLDALEFDEHLVGADLVLTGEGRLDGQTMHGKAIAGIGHRAHARGVPVGALVGALAPDLDLAALAAATGVSAVLPLAPGPCTLEESIANTAPWLEAAAHRAAQWMSLHLSSR